MNIDKALLDKVAHLARLELTDSEKDEFTPQLNDIIRYIEKIGELDTGSVKSADHIMEVKNVFREDKVNPSIPIDEIEKIAPDFQDSHFVVPKIID